MSPIEVIDSLAAVDGWLRLSPRIVRRGPVKVQLLDDGEIQIGVTGVVCRPEVACSVARALSAALSLA